MKHAAARFALPACLLLAACGGASEPEVPKTSLATAQAGALTVELLANLRLETGLQPVWVKVTDAAKAPVDDATVGFVPTMSMTGGTAHGAPVFGPAVAVGGGLYRVDAVFQMATSAMGAWSAKVPVQRPGAAAATAEFPALTVADAGRAKTFSHTDPATAKATRFVVSLNFKAAPKVGLNPIVVTVHEMKDMMTFAPCADLALAVDPQMPSMGHGSPGSVNPTRVADGRYEGLLSLSMPGDWETTVAVSDAAGALGAVKVLTTF